MVQQLNRSVYQLRQILFWKDNLLVNTGKTILEYLLFPALFWLLLWLTGCLCANFSYWPTNLIATFALPLSILFFAYRLTGLLMHFTVEQEIYHVLVNRFFFPLLATHIIIQTIGLLTEISLLGDTELFAFGETKVTLRSLFIVSVGMYLWSTGVDGFSKLFRNLLTRHMGVEEGVLDGSLILLRYFLIGFGLFFAFSQIKLDTTAIAAISGGLAVGVGFAFREVIVNFVSGIMLLFERSLYPGDVIEINGEMGQVKDINIRATTIRTNDNLDVVIPNQYFLTDNLISYTHNSSLTRFQLEVPAACEHNPETVIAIILDVTREHLKILSNLNADVQVVSFGENNINYQLNVWTDNPLKIDSVRSDLYRLIWQAFAEHGIEIGSDQTD
ncbi:small-conductance mechanosensitive channel [Xenococcus sp. PCC 7305]|uniref:mechanosensitive ion channel family protein n=1 Tax=Xenococcus sp. PCC 7305 TaxID=102125 RepID=UPI0002ACEAC4|nr:mechanosensitive ion channel domain-containing protein [Xenococcus sp. PCC 7305]ELS05322.1 small-conductance mechanosensitive channel [Xenococcus sp. PCC 7305]